MPDTFARFSFAPGFSVASFVSNKISDMLTIKPTRRVSCHQNEVQLISQAPTKALRVVFRLLPCGVGRRLLAGNLLLLGERRHSSRFGVLLSCARVGQLGLRVLLPAFSVRRGGLGSGPETRFLRGFRTGVGLPASRRLPGLIRFFLDRDAAGVLGHLSRFPR